MAQQLGHSVEVLYATYAGIITPRKEKARGFAAIEAMRRGEASEEEPEEPDD